MITLSELKGNVSTDFVVALRFCYSSLELKLTFIFSQVCYVSVPEIEEMEFLPNSKQPQHATQTVYVVPLSSDEHLSLQKY